MYYKSKLQRPGFSFAYSYVFLSFKDGCREGHGKKLLGEWYNSSEDWYMITPHILGEW